MSDLEDRNAEALEIGLVELESRLRALEQEVLVSRNNQQTILNLISELQKSNTLALQQMRGTGATSGD